MTLKTIIKPESQSKNSNALSFYDHLDEFRSVLIRVFVAVFVSSCVSYYFVDSILAMLIRSVDYVVFTAPADAFVARIILALFTGCLFVFPYVLYEFWAFISIGLNPQEKKYIKYFGPASLFLFLIGAVFSYFIVTPIAIQFLLGFSSDILVPMITIKSYISFIITMICSFGVIFELPLVLIFLTKIGIATPEFLIQKRKFAIVIMLIVSALITPPDVITQLILAAPLMILYELGILMSKLTYKSREHAGSVIILLCLIFAATGCEASEENGELSRKQALMIAESTEEVKAFYGLSDGQFRNCIKSAVLKSCDSDWVTCIDDAWVVKHEFAEECKVKHDGRLSVTLLIDGHDGKVISRFPEVGYMTDRKYCLEDYDCVAGNKGECLNFIYGQLTPLNDQVQANTNCRCAQNQCQ